MSMERWNPFQEMDDMQRMMNRYFGDFGRGMTSGREGTASTSMAIDLIETEQGYELRATLPGVNAEDIAVKEGITPLFFYCQKNLGALQYKGQCLSF
jgi:HSP20 family protein